jgi:hypothetical protein
MRLETALLVGPRTLVAVLAATLLCACGGGGDDSGGSPTQTTTGVELRLATTNATIPQGDSARIGLTATHPIGVPLNGG